MVPSIAHTAAALSALPAGARAGLWLADDVAEAAVPLLISPLSSDPDLSRLRQQIARQGADGQLGVLYVGAEGAIKMGLPGATGPHLSALARWVRAQVAAHPSLAHLVGAALIDVQPDGTVGASFARDKLWRELERPAAAGTIDETAAALGAMQPGDQAWFWLSQRGPGGKPFLSLVPATDPAELAPFQQRARALERCSPPGERIRGIARMTASGTLLLLTDDHNVDWHRILCAIRAAHGRRLPGLRAITRARLVVRQDKALRYLDRPHTDKLDLSREAALLEGEAAEEPLWFWLTTADPDRQPRLLLDTDRDALKARAQAVGGSGATCQGQIRRDEGDALVFCLRRPLDGDLALWLRRFVADHRRHWPALRALRGAQVRLVKKSA